MNRTKTQYSSLTAPEISRSDWYNRISPWTLEVTAAVFSALCISTITLILWSINGKPYEAWQLLRTDITPNTLLSIVSTLAKSSLLLTIAAGLGQAKWLHLQKDRRLADIQAFDEATRGPLGALRLLWRTRLRALLAAVGCMLTILVLATEPFVQQILTYSSVIGVASNETCAVAAMSTMPGPGLRSGEAGLLVQADSLMKLTGALSQGISGEPVEPLHTCPSGNCSWPHFKSLGVCSRCRDRTGSVLVECSDDLANTCSYTMDDQHTFFANWSYHPYDSHTQQMQPSNILELHVFNSSWLLNNLNEVQMDNVLNATVAEISTFRLNAIYEIPIDEGSNNSSKAEQKHMHIRPEIRHCSFDLCLKDYHGSNSLGSTFQETLASETALAIDLSACTEWMRSNDNATSNTRCPLSRASEVSSSSVVADEYWIEIVNFLSLEYVLVTQLNVSASGNDDSANEIIGLTYWYANEGNITRTFEGIATSLTNQLRRHDNVTMVNGTVYMPVTYVNVNWLWLVYPVLISISTSSFLVASMICSWQSGIPVWKSSSLALLFHGLVNRPRVKTNSLHSMEDMASKVKARLMTSENGHFQLDTAAEIDE